MIETRQKEIFDYLSADDAYHTSEEIGSALEISPSTVKKEIAYLNSVIEENGAKIKSTKGKGYKFKVVDEKSFTEFLKNDWRRYAYYHSINSSVDFRIENIIKLFLFSDTYIRQQDIAEKFHLSLSQVNKDIKKTKKILEKYNLSLASKPHYGMKIIGDEKDIRIAIKNEIGEESYIFDIDKDRKILNTIEEVVEELNFNPVFNMPYVEVKNLIIHIYIAILRINQGITINLPIALENKVILYDEFEFAKKIVEELNQRLDIMIPQDEIHYIAMHLISKNRIGDIEKISLEITELTENMLEEIYMVSKYDFRGDIDLYLSLSQHLAALLERMKYGFEMKNPILDDIKSRGIAYHLATIGISVINNKYNTIIKEDEIGYIALHLLASMEDKSSPKKNILIVCGSGNASARLLKAQIEDKFQGAYNKLDTLDITKINNESVEVYDIIISSVDLNIETDIPIIYVDILLKQRDYMNINKAFDQEELAEIYSIFENSIFIHTDQIDDFESAMDFLAKTISQKIGLDKSHVKNQLIKREELNSTGIGKISIPHMMEQADSHTFSVIIISDKPIKWKNGEKIQIMYSLIVGNSEEDLKLYYKKLGRFLGEEKLVDEAIQSKNMLEFCEIFMKG